jgi:anti-sigma B factor antagonist
MATQIDQLFNQNEFGVTVRETGNVTIVALAGELDLATAGTLRETLLLLELDGGINVAIDLRGLSFLGSTGIGIIVAACKRIRAGGGTFSVWCDDGFARRTLEIAGLVDYLELHDGEEEYPNQRGESLAN